MLTSFAGRDAASIRTHAREESSVSIHAPYAAIAGAAVGGGMASVKFLRALIALTAQAAPFAFPRQEN